MIRKHVNLNTWTGVSDFITLLNFIEIFFVFQTGCWMLAVSDADAIISSFKIVSKDFVNNNWICFSTTYLKLNFGWFYCRIIRIIIHQHRVLYLFALGFCVRLKMLSIECKVESLLIIFNKIPYKLMECLTLMFFQKRVKGFKNNFLIFFTLSS